MPAGYNDSNLLSWSSVFEVQFEHVIDIYLYVFNLNLNSFKNSYSTPLDWGQNF